ncbi:MAG: hypothetical protein WA080_05900 [Sulfuricurvum sp.]
MRTTRHKSRKKFTPSTDNVSNAFRFGIFGIIALVLIGKGCQEENDCGPNHDQECREGSGSSHSSSGSSHSSSKSSFFSSTGDGGDSDSHSSFFGG